MIEQNWLIFGAVALLALLVLIWLIGRASRPQERRREARPDVLDEGAAPAARNQSLIDSPMAATFVPVVTVDPGGGLGEMAAAPVETARGNAEAEQWEAAERAEAEPSAAATSIESPPVEAAAADDLGRLKGVGPKLVALLRTLGVSRYDQIAGWSDADIDRIDAQLGPFQGRIRRDDWVEQARLLAGGDTGAYEARFGKL